MSKKHHITHIQLENYRAFYGSENHIDLPKGENLLIYGENGSGKSSLYDALWDYFENLDDFSRVDILDNIFENFNK